MEGKAAGEDHSGCGAGDGAEQREGEIPEKPAVTALALISQLQSQPRENPPMCVPCSLSQVRHCCPNQRREGEKHCPLPCAASRLSWHPESGIEGGSTKIHSILLKLPVTVN